jgi:hypothetical protein
LANADCNVKQKIDGKITLWSGILAMRAKSVDVDSLNDIPFDTQTNFMKVERDYSSIATEGKNIDATLKAIFEDYASTTIAEVKNKADQLAIVKIPAEQKKAIEAIVKTGKLPDTINQQLIDAINKLFVDIKIVQLKKEDVINALFKKDELVTLAQLSEAFFNLKEKLEKQNKGQEVRFKID